ncbi:MAG: hypothetical protein US68_C0003G0033 [Candidatus Shapirobacteria bacterium GW2011_GWE1_38_10]|uniref:Uncharacterized protein n=1 Tax=Candidatus Shapirobacteria bacterium GW2011_GWE1_38_10 TaxID=1618488 RepID=A0A0G0I824_9BACT|nr:MAG: hypothetical protein US46_C0008G0003 [Candidatus Shapirobacteria bacterium GW2011_GWF2_37_20]KKQ50667.1 MAG: hypothetical protein US68_C0003G0033 [Candidatus Shapirobacteria bacterium GW2011_GWE1_38_10]KKQ64378.1 MAG: hypothetical protein US85_C0010G0010 [Candidatus Shapirobacteria bacterium GW2011_GWF1_38_23]HBP51632.1 hypothetical protein [Candidatus Shapirobacteria bacterium]
MTEKQPKIVAYNFRLPAPTDNKLVFNLKVVGTTVISSHCRPCDLIKVCFGQKGNKTGEGRINLDLPIAQNLTPEAAQKVPCGAGIEVVQRRSPRN